MSPLVRLQRSPREGVAVSIPAVESTRVDFRTGLCGLIWQVLNNHHQHHRWRWSVEDIDMTSLLLLDLHQVCSTTSLSKSTIYELVKSGDFPRPLRIPGTRRKAWLFADVQSVINSWAQQSSK
jgi:prophage regulatory protein